MEKERKRQCILTVSEEDSCRKRKKEEEEERISLTKQQDLNDEVVNGCYPDKKMDRRRSWLLFPFKCSFPCARPRKPKKYFGR